MSNVFAILRAKSNAIYMLHDVAQPALCELAAATLKRDSFIFIVEL